jgi:hypothetical protein
MRITSEDYERAIEIFVTDMRRLGDDLTSVVLFGSVARGEVVPGKSDLIDSVVFLRENIFEDREGFVAALSVMVEACERLSKIGIPFHPFMYYSLDETDRTPAVYLSGWGEDFTRVIFGEDLRPRLSSSDMSRTLARESFFEMRRYCHSFAAYLNKRVLTKQEHKTILLGLIIIKKYIPQTAALALDIWNEPSIVAQDIKQLLPQIDISVLQTINDLRALPVEDIASDSLLEVLREALLFVERLHDEILAVKKLELMSEAQL